MAEVEKFTGENINGAVRKKDRIIYVEPNDVYDKDSDNANGGLALTPKYEDFCITFNLIIETVKRMKTDMKSGQAPKDGTSTWNIEWGVNHEEMLKRRTSILQGDRGHFVMDADGKPVYDNEKYNYLTTYYTDIDFDSYKEKTQIEGLGVESVQITYESWYTPTVVIKFVDVRGSALFGREEAIHVNEKLTVDNVFGAFFTMPYPLFRLQVKGFLGKAVTYQLTCSSFKGEFNSQTGNFEATATFIGYSWSLLTDIPFLYLVAAPQAPYIGKDYWNAHKGKTEWRLWQEEGTYIEPPTLKELFEKINTADSHLKNQNSAVTSSENEEMQTIGNEKNLLNEISTRLNSFLVSIKNDVDNNYIQLGDEDAKKEQLLLFKDGDDSEPTTLLKPGQTLTLYDEFYESLTQYCNVYTDSDITLDKAPNGWNIKQKTITFRRKLSVERDNNGNIRRITLANNGDRLDTMLCNENDGKLTTVMVDFLQKNINGQEKNTVIKNFLYLIDLYDLQNLIRNRLKTLGEREKQILRDVNDRIEYRINDIIGMKPFIGNIFKIIFCHLETFCHIIFDSAEEIYKQGKNAQRTPDYLGIGFESTDIKGGAIKYITPWPAIFDGGKETSECGYEDNENKNFYGWVGDLKEHRFIEEKVVYSLQEGIQTITRSMNRESEALSEDMLPITPSDFITGESPFSGVKISNLSDLSGYLSIRMASILGILSGNDISSNIAKLLGKMDAYNFYGATDGIVEFKSVLNSEFITTVKGISCCHPNYDDNGYEIVQGTNKRYHSFENGKIEDSLLIENWNKGRHPMFVSPTYNSFIHWYGKNKDGENKVSLVPSTLMSFESYKHIFVKKKDTNGKLYFTPEITDDNDGNKVSLDWLYKCDTTELGLKEKEEPELPYIDPKKFINKYMFSFVTDTDNVKRIFEKSEYLRNNTVKVYECEFEDNLTDYISTYLKVGRQYSSKFFKNYNHMLSGNLDMLNVDKKNLLSSKFYGKSETKYDFTYDGWDWKQNSTIYNEVSVNDDGDFLFNGQTVSLSNLVIQQFKIVHFGTECSLFGCPFYYLQNVRFNVNGKDESEKEYKDRVLRVKALLFLHTFKYDYLNTNLNVFSKNKKTGGMESVPKGYLLFLGAMLWRNRYFEDNGCDPINYNTGKTRVNDDIDQYKSPGKENTLFLKSDKYLYLGTLKNGGDGSYTYKVSDLFGGDYNIDSNIENQLIKLFDNFVINTFSKISSRYELKDRISDTKGNEYTSATFKEDVAEFNEAVEGYKDNIATSKSFESWLRTNGIEKWDGKYSAINIASNNAGNVNDYGLKLLFNETDGNFQEVFKDLYAGYFIVADSCHRRMGKSKNGNEEILINNELVDSYLDGFLSGANNIISKTTVNVGGDENLNVSTETVENRDISINIYYYIKNLWDKWLLPANSNDFDVANFFTPNFIFIDQFYKNTFHYLAINCQIFYDLYRDISEDSSIFNFLTQLLKKHGCMMMPTPDYIGFDGRGMEGDIELMRDLFRPVPYSLVGTPSNCNKFIVMYVCGLSKNASEDNAYVSDTYDIWSYSDKQFTPVAQKLFGNGGRTNPDDGDMITRFGYNVPSFAVSFGRQNNHIFKNIKASMENPVMTGQAIKALANIAEMGSGRDRKVRFIGQDTFTVFSNYSYSVTFEMMGNAQICPLMYFQLLNIPLWNGTYMIYKVTHNMTPGNMTTTVTAMKMSKFAKPFNTTFFTINKNLENGSDEGGYRRDCDDENENYSYNGDTTYLESVFFRPNVINWDIRTTMNYMAKKYHNPSGKSKCCRGVLEGLEEGGIKDVNGKRYQFNACEAHFKLLGLGFKKLMTFVRGQTEYTPLAGDIIVYRLDDYEKDKNADHKLPKQQLEKELSKIAKEYTEKAHIQIYDGKGSWYSDFKTKKMFVEPKYSNCKIAYIYRYPNSNGTTGE